METGEDKVMTINLHKIVTRECGPVPFENCYMMKKPHDVVGLLFILTIHFYFYAICNILKRFQFQT